MLRFVSEPLGREVAVLYRRGPDTLVILNSDCHDPGLRCAVVNRLLSRLAAGRRLTA